jgi:predicted nucleotidyltransferase
MRLDLKETIAGLPIIKIRDVLRRAGSDEWQVEYFAHQLKLPVPKARKVVQELLERRWIERVPPPPRRKLPIYYRRTLLGGSVALAKAIKPLSRPKAEQILKEFLTRVDEVNARDELTHIVTRVRLFGSLLDRTKEDFGDIDLVMDIEQRPIPGRDLVKYSLERARQSGKRFNNYLQELFYGETEVRRLLKGGSRYLSFHRASDLQQTGAKSKVIFPRRTRSRRS